VLRGGGGGGGGGGYPKPFFFFFLCIVMEETIRDFQNPSKMGTGRFSYNLVLHPTDCKFPK
jgi:hypothetical protein